MPSSVFGVIKTDVGGIRCSWKVLGLSKLRDDLLDCVQVAQLVSFGDTKVGNKSII